MENLPEYWLNTAKVM